MVGECGHHRGNGRRTRTPEPGKCVGFIPYLGGLVYLGVVCLGLGAFALHLYGASRRPRRMALRACAVDCWFERLLVELQAELLVGDAAEIRTRRFRKQKTDRQDAQRILELMLKDDFPQIRVPSGGAQRTTALQTPVEIVRLRE